MIWYKRLMFEMLEYLAENYFKSDKTTQRYIGTAKNRYPDIFAETKRFFEQQQLVPEILSFGCSHGEELITLRSYFPQSPITGVENNPVVLSLARWRARKAMVSFEKDLERLAGKKQFHAVFAMAVLQRSDDNNEQREIFRFNDFEYWVGRLDLLVQRGGLLIIDNADYDFELTTTSRSYEPLAWKGNLKRYENRAFYDRNSKRIPGPVSVNRIFLKK